MDSIDQQLEEMLRRAETSLCDDGFSESVLNRLPKRRLNRAKCRRWTLAGAAAMGSILTLLLAPPVESAFRIFELFDRYQTVIFLAFLFLAVLLVPVAWILYSHFSEDIMESSGSRIISPFRGRMPKL